MERPLMNVTKVGTLQAPAINGEAHQVRPGETWPMWAQSADMRLSAMEYFCVSFLSWSALVEINHGFFFFFFYTRYT